MSNRKINTKINILKIVALIIFMIILYKLFAIQILKHDLYVSKYKETLKYVYSLTAPRGRIYDRNGILLVDNEAVKVIRYSSIGISKEEEKETIMKLSKIIDMKEEKITKKINTGYAFDIKTIKESVSEREYAIIAEQNLKGVILDLNWKRVYKTKYFRSMFGNVGDIPYEKKDYYLNLGYSLNDKVGTSFMEEAYDEILKGEKSKYLLKNSKYELIKEGKKGNDIYLTIDIKLQEKIEKILDEEIKKAKKEENTKYYDHSYVIISDPNTGEILAMAGKKIVKNKMIDITPEILTTTIQGGSSVKAASNIVGYKTGALKIGETRKDFCIKLKNLNAKCSWKNLGILTDLEALKYSSNSFQYQTVIKVGQGKYKYNGNLNLKDETLDIYRETFKEFGLGVKTGIDLNESSGFMGNKKNTELVLDFAVGQYDTYTPLQFNQYINTVANNGYRLKPLLLKAYQKDGRIIESKKEVLNTLSIADKFLNRVKKGLRMVMDIGGTGYSYINSKYQAAGKTGTSTSYLDLNKDGILETPATSNIFVGYAPYDKPVVSFTVISPNVRLAYGSSSHKTSVNKKISYQVSQKFFEIYK